MKKTLLISAATILMFSQCGLFSNNPSDVIPGNKWVCQEYFTKAEYEAGTYPEPDSKNKDVSMELYGQDGTFTSYYADTGESALGEGIEKSRYKIDETGIYFDFYEDGRWWGWDNSGIPLKNVSSTTFDLVEETDPDYPLYVKCKLVGEIKSEKN